MLLFPTFATLVLLYFFETQVVRLAPVETGSPIRLDRQPSLIGYPTGFT